MALQIQDKRFGGLFKKKEITTPSFKEFLTPQKLEPQKGFLRKLGGGALKAISTGEFAVGGILSGRGIRAGIKEEIEPAEALGIENKALRFLINTAFDPLTYMTFGAGAGAKITAKAALKAGLKKEIVGKVLNREGQQVLQNFAKKRLKGITEKTLGDVSKSKAFKESLFPDARSFLEEKIKEEGLGEIAKRISKGENLLDAGGIKFLGQTLIPGKQVKGAFELTGLPFAKRAIGKGIAATEAGKKLISAKEEVKEAMALAFKKRPKIFGDLPTMAKAEQLFEETERLKRFVRSERKQGIDVGIEFENDLKKLVKAGEITDKEKELAYRVFEGQLEVPSKAFKEKVEEMRVRFLLKKAQRIEMDLPVIESEKFLPRILSEEGEERLKKLGTIKEGKGFGAREMSVKNFSQELLKAFEGSKAGKIISAKNFTEILKPKEIAKVNKKFGKQIKTQQKELAILDTQKKNLEIAERQVFMNIAREGTNLATSIARKETKLDIAKVIGKDIKGFAKPQSVKGSLGKLLKQKEKILPTSALRRETKLDIAKVIGKDIKGFAKPQSVKGRLGKLLKQKEEILPKKLASLNEEQRAVEEISRSLELKRVAESVKIEKQFRKGVRIFRDSDKKLFKAMQTTISEIEDELGPTFHKNLSVINAIDSARHAKLVGSSQMAHWLKNNGFVLSEKEAPANWVVPSLFKDMEQFNKDFKGLKMAPEFAQIIDRAHKAVINDDATKKILQLYDAIQDTWKGWTLGIFPAYYFRNMVGNIWNNFLGGVYNPKVYQIASRIQSNADGEVAGRTFQELRELLPKMNLTKTGQYSADLRTSIQKELAEPKLFTLGVNNVVMKKGFQLGNLVEDNAKIAHVVDRLLKGSTLEEAVVSAKKFLFDYSDLTPFEQSVMKRIFPFYSWTRNNVPLQIERFAKQPAKFMALQKLSEESGVDVSLLDRDRDDNLVIPVPNSIAKILGLEGNKQRFVNLRQGNILPATDLLKIADPASLSVEMLTPLLKGPLEYSLNYSFFTGRKIEEFPGETGSFLGLELQKKDINALRNIRLLSEIDKLLKPEDFGEEERTIRQNILQVLTGFKVETFNEKARAELMEKLQNLENSIRKSKEKKSLERQKKPRFPRF